MLKVVVYDHFIFTLVVIYLIPVTQTINIYFSTNSVNMETELIL